ncbi:MlaD family protein [Rhodococcus sp. G-MC3]|uniref:MlaD family protein n=1 Tax=Rhodococcus sp. G-MC3 TaxID=3046209 RepID=UPI0024B992F5|nr:MlaD family protein [Rhodococcus sp. G-MC3]MDJ0392670.1 MlaD family protein [Rhodococcus sp. G-MC3]
MRIALFTGLIVVMLVGVISAIERPVDGPTATFDAVFTDVSGLKAGNDVRMLGVSVGKVEAIDLQGNEARVRFSLQGDRPLYGTSTLSIRYQNLTGQRYVDIKQPNLSGGVLRPGATIGIDHTVPSFDITSLFNGMEPVLTEFSPEALNQFMTNAIAVIEGDGKAVGATLDAVGKLASYVTDRQAVISLLLKNFERVSEQLGGKSPETAILIEGIADVFVNLQKQFDGLLEFVSVAPPVLGPLNSLMAALGFSQPNNPDLQNALRMLNSDPQATADQLGKLPGLVQALTALIPSRDNHVNMECARGSADVPTAVRVLIAGQRISVCKG